jgi:hypothetical protein
MDHDVRDPLCVDVPLLRPAPREKREPMPLITLARQHKRTLEEAQGSLETAVHKVLSQGGALIRQVLGPVDHRRVQRDGVGFWGEMWVEAQEVHVAGDFPPVGEAARAPDRHGAPAPPPADVAAQTALRPRHGGGGA